MPVMDNEVDVLVKTTADTAGATATTAALEDMGAKAKLQAESGAASFEKFNRSLGDVSGQAVKVGRSMSEFVSLPIAAVGFESVKMASQFQQTMEMLHTNAGTAQKDIAGLSEEVLKMAPQVGAGPDKLAEALYHIASAGNGLWDTAKQMDILKVAAEGAAIGQANLDDTTYSLTSALASNVGGAKNAAEMMAVLNATVGAGDMKLQDLNAAIGTGFLGTAETFGISIQSVGAALATLTDNGEHADAAATRLRMTWALMTAPSKQAAGLLGDLGLNAEDAAKSTAGMSEVFAKTGLSTTKLADDLRQPNGMMVALKDLKDHLEAAGLSSSETDAVLSKTFGGGRTDAALLSLLGNLDRMDEKFKMINENTSKFGDNWAAQQQTANQQFHEAWAGIEASLIKLGDEVMPAATKIFKEFSHDIQDVSQWFGHLTGGQQEFILKAAAMVAVAGPALLILGKLGKAASETGDFIMMAGKAMGLFKTESVVAEAAKGATALGRGAGLAGALEAGAPAAAGFGAALAPVLLGVGAVAAVAVGAAVVINKVSDAHKAAAKSAADHAKAAADNAKQLSTDAGANQAATKLIDDYTKSQDAAKKKDEDAKKAKQDLDQAQKNYNDTAKATSEALKKYGPSSQQYLDALIKEADANVKLKDATDSWNKVADAATKAHASVKAAADNTNATYYTAQQYTQKFDADTKALSSSKDKEREAHRKVDDAAKGYKDTLMLTGPQSDATKAAAERLVKAKDTEQKSQESVSWWTRRVHDDLVAERDAADRLGGAIDNLASKNSKLSGIFKNGPSSKGLPQFATGVQNFAGGAAIVGEQGPELVYLPPGSDVIPSDQTKAMLTPGASGAPSSGGSSHGGVTIQQLIVNTTQPMRDVLRDLDQEHILSTRGMAPNRGQR